MGADIVAKTLTAYRSINMQYDEGDPSIPVFLLDTRTTPAMIQLGRNETEISLFEIYPETSFHNDVYMDKTTHAETIYAKAIIMDANIRLEGEKKQGVSAVGPDENHHYIIGYGKDDRTTYVGMPGSGSKTTSTQIRGNAVVLTTAGSITPSDERLKNSFKSLSEFDDVYMDIKPCAFKYNHGTSGRFHFGAKAGDVKKSFENHGFTTKDFGGFVQMSDSEENDGYCGNLWFRPALL